MTDARYVEPASFIGFVHSNTSVQLQNSRRCKCINGVPITPNDNRVLRRWRSGSVKRITTKAAEAFLGRYGLTLNNYKETTTCPTPSS